MKLKRYKNKTGKYGNKSIKMYANYNISRFITLDLSVDSNRCSLMVTFSQV